MSEEIWKPVVGSPAYEVSTLGRVRSLPQRRRQMSRWGTYYWHSTKGKLLKPGIASNGYPTVAIGRGNTRTVHSLVAEAFIGPYPEGCEVRHKDGDRENPKLDNLEYGSRTDNIFDAVNHGSWHSKRRRDGWGNMWKTRRAVSGKGGHYVLDNG